MGYKLHNRIEIWKKLLLDFGKRNRLINFLEGKRNNVKITAPSFDSLWELIVVNEREIIFPYAKKVQVNDEGEEVYETIIEGDIETNRPIGDLQKTLKALRYKANTSIEEQGINTLYLTFGMLRWKERDDSSQVFSSPIILVPVKLLIESILSPYRLVLHDDEIVINPTLSHKLNNDFGIIIPEFDSAHDSPSEYIEKLFHKVENKGWNVEKSTHLTNLSFLKINMYKDLERNEEKLNSNIVIAALAGEQDPIQVTGELNNFDHDKQIRPIDTFQVVDADSSQQDAVLLSKKGASFVLQGPPGTGKSQTITNIISEAIADGKKVLFVSEKMAALQVVYNRLANVGLADFCLTLHSHKAKKKDILRDLANSINIDHTRVRDEALTQLDLLERKRNLLNKYQEELHTPTSGLNVSIYSVNGKLAKLENVPDVVFSISDVDTVTTDILNERIYLLNELSKTIGKRSEDYSSNVWHDSSVKFLSNALRQEIDSNVTIAIPLMKELAEQHSLICSKLGINFELSLIGTDNLVSILSFAAKSPSIPIEWIIGENIDVLIDKAHRYKEEVEQIVKTKNELKSKFSDSFFDYDAVKHKENLCSLMLQLQTRIKDDDNWISQNISKINRELISITNGINSLFEEAKSIAFKLGIPAPNTIAQIILFFQSVQALADVHNVHPTQKWFNSDELVRIKSNIEVHKSLHSSMLELMNSILSRFDKEVLEWNFYPVLQRFRGEYKSYFRFLNGKYREDIKQLNSYSSKGEKLSYNDAFETLNILKSISDSQAAITANTQYYSEDYGNYYSGINTQWDVLSGDLDKFENSVHQLHTLTSQLQNLIVQGELPISDIMQFNTHYSTFNIESAFKQIRSILKCDLDETVQWNDIEIYVRESSSLATAFISEYQDLINRRKAYCNYESAISDLDLLISFNTLNKDLVQQKDSIYNLYKDYYNGVETDWEKLINALEYAVELKNFITLYNLPEPFVKDICGNSRIISYCYDEYLKISKQKDAVQKGITWFASLFNNGEEFFLHNILDLAVRMSLCKDKKYLLEEWVDYCSNREKCNKAGLGEYLYKVEEFGVDSNYIVDSYLKRFYRLWLDAVLPNFPEVQNFRGRIQSQTINEFCELDKGQFKIAQARVRERVLSRIPDFNSINGARDEIAVLKKELNKQNNIEIILENIL